MIRSQELRLRIISGLVLGTAVLFITWWDAVSFALLCGFAGIILAREWWALTKTRSRMFIPFGLIYISGAIATLIYLRFQSPMFIFWLFALVWTGDIAAYAVGKVIGRHKIAPSISPGKSWEGLAGASIAVSGLILTTQNLHQPLQALLYGTAIAVISIAGDMFESYLKRCAGVKDSGTLIPGHGGLFDRTDALIACAFVMGIIIVTDSVTLLGQLPMQTD